MYHYTTPVTTIDPRAGFMYYERASEASSLLVIFVTHLADFKCFNVCAIRRCNSALHNRERYCIIRVHHIKAR